LNKKKGKLPPQYKNMDNVKLNRMLFIYSLNGLIKCLSEEELRPVESQMLHDGWKHTATIDPARWIESMANWHEDPSDMLDQIQFVTQHHDHGRIAFRVLAKSKTEEP